MIVITEIKFGSQVQNYIRQDKDEALRLYLDLVNGAYDKNFKEFSKAQEHCTYVRQINTLPSIAFFWTEAPFHKEERGFINTFKGELQVLTRQIDELKALMESTIAAMKPKAVPSRSRKKK